MTPELFPRERYYCVLDEQPDFLVSSHAEPAGDLSVAVTRGAGEHLGDLADQPVDDRIEHRARVDGRELAGAGRAVPDADAETETDTTPTEDSPTDGVADASTDS